MAIILRRGTATIPAAANIDLWNRTAEEIADWMIAADREKTGEVWRLLGERLAPSLLLLSSGSILLIHACGHGSKKPQ
jgi:hypothetical protein